MIELYGFGPQFGLIDGSPFVAKIHAFLKLTNLEYRAINDLKNFSKAPKGKLPFIIDGGKTISDSQFIQTHLSRKYQLTLDDHLNPKQKAQAHLMTKSLDENLYWCLYWSRWQHETSWQIVKQAYFSSLPLPIRAVFPAILRRKAIKAIHAQGLGRHSEEEILTIANQSFQALSDLLSEQQYFFGDQPCAFDATAFAFLSAFNHCDIDNPMNRCARQFANLQRYTDDFKTRYFSE